MEITHDLIHRNARGGWQANSKRRLSTPSPTLAIAPLAVAWRKGQSVTPLAAELMPSGLREAHQILGALDERLNISRKLIRKKEEQI